MKGSPQNSRRHFASRMQRELSQCDRLRVPFPSQRSQDWPGRFPGVRATSYERARPSHRGQEGEHTLAGFPAPWLFLLKEKCICRC